MGAEIYRPDFSRGPKKRPDPVRQLHLKGVTELPVPDRPGVRERPATTIDDAVGAMVIFKLLRDELRDVSPEDFEDLVAELHDAAADRHDFMTELDPAERDIAVNEARQEIAANRQQQPPHIPKQAS